MKSRSVGSVFILAVAVALARPECREWCLQVIGGIKSISRPSKPVAAPRINCGTTGVVTQGQRFTYPLLVTPSNTWFGAAGLPAGWCVDLPQAALSGIPQVPGNVMVMVLATNVAGVATRTIHFKVAHAGTGGTGVATPVPSLPQPHIQLQPGPGPFSPAVSPGQPTNPPVRPAPAVSGGVSPAPNSSRPPATPPSSSTTIAAVKPTLLVEITPAHAFGRSGDLAHRLYADFLTLAQTELQRSGQFEVISSRITPPQRRPSGVEYNLGIDVVKFLLTIETKNQLITFNGRYKFIPKVAYVCNWNLTRDGFVRGGDRAEGQVVGREFVYVSATARNGRTIAPNERQVFQHALEHGEWPSSETMKQMIGDIRQQLLSVTGTNSP